MFLYLYTIIHILHLLHGQLLYTESPANPTMDIVDIEGLAAFAKTIPDMVTAVDSTLVSPYLIQPIKLGMDISIHSWSVVCSFIIEESHTG